MRELERDRHQEDKLPALAIVGSGRVGQAIAGAAARGGLVVALAGRDDLEQVCDPAEAALLCVPDTAIREACESVAAAGRLRFIGHTSGATGLDALAPATERGVAAFSLHPLQTIPDGGCDLTGTAAAVAGSNDEALAFAADLARALGLRPFEVPEAGRAAYHAAASMASNFLVALEESAVEVMERAGIESPRELLAPLVLRSAANWAERGPEALTGPIARGDEETVTRHLAALAEANPELVDVYLALAERTRAMARTEAAA